jgi:multidrug efflux system membrane fusion protein
VVKPDGTAEMRAIVVERTEGEQTVVAKGLEAGETVVTTGQLRVVPGGKVAPRAG